MTTGKRAFGEKSNLLGQDAGAKQLFKDAGTFKTPAKALGDRTNKTPGPSSFRFKNAQLPDGGSPSKGGGSGSPIKGLGLKENGKSRSLISPEKGAKSASPQKGSSKAPLRSINGKLKESSATPFSKADQSYATDASAMMTPAPSGSALKQRLISRQNSFVTPAANIGKAGQIKARMGEMMDAELGINLDQMDAPEVEQAPVVQAMTEEELYPEIEYMPPSTWATNPPYEFPAELDGLPRGKELGAELAKFRAAGFVRAGDLVDSDSDVDTDKFGADRFDELLDQPLDLEVRSLTSDDETGFGDDLWPDVTVETRATTTGPTSTHKSVTAPSATRTGVPARRPVAAAAAAGARPVTKSAATRPTSGTSTTTRTPAASRLAASTRSAATAATRSTAPSARVGVRPSPATTGAPRSTLSRSIATPVTRAPARSTAAPASIKPPAKRVMNPKLKDLANDELGEFVDKKLSEGDGFEGLALGDEA